MQKILLFQLQLPLVKTAAAGEDPNWGRIVMGIGKSGEFVDSKNLRLKLEILLLQKTERFLIVIMKKIKEYME